MAWSLEKEKRKSERGSYLFTDELLPEELPGLEHVRDVIQRTESFVFVLVLLLNTDGGVGRGWGEKEKTEEEKLNLNSTFKG